MGGWVEGGVFDVWVTQLFGWVVGGGGGPAGGLVCGYGRVRTCMYVAERVHVAKPLVERQSHATTRTRLRCARVHLPCDTHAHTHTHTPVHCASVPVRHATAHLQIQTL